jgi:hypothetical protein
VQFRAHFRSGMNSVDTSALIDHAKRLLAEPPRARAELGRLLAEHWPGCIGGTAVGGGRKLQLAVSR